MTTTFKNASLLPIDVGTDVLYTMPALTNGVAMSALATTTNNAMRTAAIGVLRSGESIPSWLAKDITVSAGSSVNLLAGKVSLNAGDRLVANQPNASAGQFTLVSNGHPYIGEPSLLLSNATGSIIIAVCPTGIFCSTDGGLTSTRSTTETLTTRVGMFFGGAFHIYTSAGTSKRTSTDGVTWTTVACTNGPVSPVNVFGDIIIKGGVAFGLASALQMVTSSDGTTWTNYGAPFPVACGSLCWTGTNFVAGNQDGDGNLYWSTNAAAWTTVAGSATTRVAVRGLAAVGGSVLALFGAQLWLSENHGASFAVISGQTSANGYPVLSTGTAFLTASSSGSESTSVSGKAGTWSNVNGPLGLDIIASQYRTFAISGTRLISPRSYSFDLALTRRGGLTVTASVVEVS